jgi:hypothetical protein
MPTPIRRPVPLACLLPRAPRPHVELGNGAPHRLRIVARIEVLVRDVAVRHFLRLYEVGEPDFVRLLADGPGDRVERDFQCEAHAGAPDAPIRKYSRLVGRHGPGTATVAVHLVRAGQDGAYLRGFETGGEWVQRVGAGIDRGVAVDGEETPLAIRVERDVVVVLAAIGVRGQLLASILQPAHGTVEMPGEPCETDFLGEQDALVAEAAADIRRDHPYRPLIDAETFGEPRPVDVGHLRRAVHLQLAEALVPLAQHGAALQGRHRLARRP